VNGSRTGPEAVPATLPTVATRVASAAPSTGYLDRWQVVRASLKDRILSGDLPGGTVLSETSLAGEYGVSRGPIRRALVDLARVGLVKDEGQKRQMVVIRLTRPDIDELYQVISALECLAVREVAARGSVIQGGELHRLLDTSEKSQAGGISVQSFHADMAFHQRLVELSGNRLLLALWETITDKIILSIATTHRADPGVIWATHNRAIAEALVARDPDAAERAVEAVFEHAHSRVIKSLPEN
jgi:DNA-binding GntR family transcriptional regulator